MVDKKTKYIFIEFLIKIESFHHCPVMVCYTIYHFRLEIKWNGHWKLFEQFNQKALSYDNTIIIQLTGVKF